MLVFKIVSILTIFYILISAFLCIIYDDNISYKAYKIGATVLFILVGINIILGIIYG